MALSTEDTLRLNVLLASNVDAIRIDEGRMVVYGLSDGNEMQLHLNPNCRDEQYLKQVRELLSGHVLGSPGGYPVFLKRWTRMGQMKDESLADLLKLGEPEAVMAVVCAPGLTDELARLAWWAAPEAEHARNMLESELVIKGTMGKELADYLVDFLPFEEDAYAIVHSVRLVLQGELINKETRQTLWNRGEKKNVFRIGFLEACPDDLPELVTVRNDSEQLVNNLTPLADAGNSLAALLIRIVKPAGQVFVATCEEVLKRPADQEVVCALLNAMGRYFGNTNELERGGEQDIEKLIQRAQQDIQQNHDAVGILAQHPGLANEVEALLLLAGVTDAISTPIFARTDAIGSLMRKKLEFVTTPLFERLSILRSAV